MRRGLTEKKIYIPPAQKTHCKIGHEWIEENIYSYVSKDGRTIKTCKQCSKDKNNRRESQRRENHLQRKYGINLAIYEQMLLEQGSRCYLCKTDIPGGMGSFAVDHCHKTHKLRKLLCYDCNTTLGRANDDPNLLERMAAYIRSYQ